MAVTRGGGGGGSSRSKESQARIDHFQNTMRGSIPSIPPIVPPRLAEEAGGAASREASKRGVSLNAGQTSGEGYFYDSLGGKQYQGALDPSKGPLNYQDALPASGRAASRSSSGGSGGGGGLYSPSAGSMTGGGTVGAGLGYLEDARNRAAELREALDADFETSKDELKQEFQFAETPEEKARIAFTLGDLESQRDAAYAAIGDGYAEAQAKVSAQAETSRQDTASEVEAVEALYSNAAGLATQGGADASAAAGTPGLAVNSDGGANAGVYSGMLAAMIPSETTYTQRMGDIATEGLEWLSSTLGGEGLAKQADLDRQTAALRTGTILSHDEKVADRVNAERMQWRQMLAGLQGDFRDRGFGLDDQGTDLMVTEGQMRQQAAEAAADRAAAAARQAASIRAANSRAAASRSAGPDDSFDAMWSLVKDFDNLDPSIQAQVAPKLRDARGLVLEPIPRQLSPAEQALAAAEARMG